MPSPTIYSLCSGLAVGKDADDRTRFRAAFMNAIAVSEFIVAGLLEFLRSCYKGFPYNKDKDPRLYDDVTTETEEKNSERAIGRITAISIAV